MLDPEAFFQPLQGSQPIVIKPENFQVRKELEVDKDGGLKMTHMKFCRFLGLLMIFNRNSLPWISLNLLPDRSMLCQKVIHRLVHSVIQYAE